MAEKREVKQCPYCSEEILATAKKCKHCHSFIEEEPVKEAQTAAVVEPKQAQKTPPPIPPKAPPPPPKSRSSQLVAEKAETDSPVLQTPAPVPPLRPSAPKPPPVQVYSTGTTTSPSPASQSTPEMESVQPPAAAYQTNTSKSVPGKINVGGTYDYPKAQIGKRIVAYIVDSLIAGLLIILYAVFVHFEYLYLLRHLWRNSYFILNFLRNFPLALFLAVWLIFYMLLRDSFGKGQSWGKKIQGLMVVNLSDNKPCSKGKSAARNGIALVIGFILGLIPVIITFAGMVDPIIAIAHPKGHRVGDMLAKTQVIGVNEYNAQNN